MAARKEEGMDSAPHVSPGEVVLKKYRVERLLGMGAMGIVAEATHLGLDQRVAIKFMLPGKDPGGDQYARFIREARASVRLTSPHVARVLDVGALDSGAPYMVMELLQGRDLEAVLRERGPLPIDEAAELILQACEAVAEAHAIGIVHRDLKPANLFLTRTKSGLPCVKVIDFGISKASNDTLKLTQREEILGSPLYMSPEQMRSSAAVDARSDVWALGATLYQLIAGTTPFDARVIQELCAKVWFEPYTPLAQRRPDAPPAFDQGVIARCLEKDREKRFQSALDLARALAPYAPPRAAGYVERVAAALGDPAEAARAAVELAATEAARAPLGSTARAVVSQAEKAATGRSKIAAAIGIALGVLVLGAAGVVGWERRRDPTPAAAVSSVPPPGASSAPIPTAQQRDEPAPQPGAAPTVDAAAPIAPTATPSATAAASKTSKARPASPAAPPTAMPQTPAPKPKPNLYDE
jgi:serine/threonine-protein kinase